MRYFCSILLFFCSFNVFAMNRENGDSLSEDGEISELYSAIEILFGDDPSEIHLLIGTIEKPGVCEQMLLLVKTRAESLLDPDYPEDPGIRRAASVFEAFVRSRRNGPLAHG